MLDTQADLTQERINKPTPNGGAYSIAYFLDKKRNPVHKELAEYVEILEFDETGKCIRVTSGYIDKEKSK